MARMARRKVTRTGAHKKKTKKVVLTDQQIAKRRAEDRALGEQLSRQKQYIVIAAGAPPHDLEGDDLDSIKEWVDKLKSAGVNHTVQSVQFWVKYYYDPFLEKDMWRHVRQIIEDNHEVLGIPNLPRPKFKGEAKVENQGW
tara:strand:- start:545 stop:967 length:423 start_codon:yes stop_codon:yes gene_type:complete